MAQTLVARGVPASGQPTASPSPAAGRAPGPADGALSMLGAVRHRAHEVWRFLAVGLASTVIEFVLFNVLLMTYGLGPVWSKVAATTVAMANAYLGNRFWSFRHRPRTGAAREAPRFVVVNVAGLALGAAAVGLAHNLLGVEGMLALNLVNAAAIAIAMVFRFWAYHHWVFPTEHRADELGLDLAPGPLERELALVGAAQ